MLKVLFAVCVVALAWNKNHFLEVSLENIIRKGYIKKYIEISDSSSKIVKKNMIIKLISKIESIIERWI